MTGSPARAHDPFENAKLTGYTRSGFAARYHAHRPRAPEALVALLLQLGHMRHPKLVVDLGCGTGLSTVLWATHADRVIGIEPLDEMRDIAVTGNSAPNVEFRDGVAQKTGLPDGSADVVTCSQSLHDMEPESTMLEVDRILRVGGVFAAYDYDVPPAVHPDAEAAFAALVRHVLDLRKQHGIRSAMQQWDKDEHVARLRHGGRFRYVKEVGLHHTEPCTAERWVGFALTLGFVPPVLDLGLPESEIGLDELRRVAAKTLGDRGLPWYVSYRVRIAIK